MSRHAKCDGKNVSHRLREVFQWLYTPGTTLEA